MNEFEILKSSLLTCWQVSLMCSIIFRVIQRINHTVPDAIHVDKEKGNRKTFHFRSYTFCFLIMILVLKLETK
jgi:hypothetical protein